MKKLILYVVGAIFLFVSCQSDEMESDEILVQSKDVLWSKAIDALNNYNSKASSPIGFKNDNAFRVTKKLKLLYVKGEIDVVPNPADYDDGGCGDVGDPLNLTFTVNGEGIGSLLGKFSIFNLGCVIPGGPEDPIAYYEPPGLLGYIITANGDVFFYKLDQEKSGPPDPINNPAFIELYWDITGGEGRFENATGWFKSYGDSSENPFQFEGEGEITFDKDKM